MYRADTKPWEIKCLCSPKSKCAVKFPQLWLLVLGFFLSEWGPSEIQTSMKTWRNFCSNRMEHTSRVLMGVLREQVLGSIISIRGDLECPVIIKPIKKKTWFISFIVSCIKEKLCCYTLHKGQERKIRNRLPR